MDSLKEKAIVEDAEAYAGELTTEEEDEGKDKSRGNTVSARKHQTVEWHHQWKDKTYKGRPGSLDERSKFVSNHTHYSSTDPDARVAVKWGKPRQLNYLGQLSVDTAHLSHHHYPGGLCQQKGLPVFAVPAFQYQRQPQSRRPAHEGSPGRCCLLFFRSTEGKKDY